MYSVCFTWDSRDLRVFHPVEKCFFRSFEVFDLLDFNLGQGRNSLGSSDREESILERGLHRVLVDGL